MLKFLRQKHDQKFFVSRSHKKHKIKVGTFLSFSVKRGMGIRRQSSKRCSNFIQEKRELFTEQRRKVDLKNTFGNWEDSPEKMRNHTMSNPNRVAPEDRQLSFLHMRCVTISLYWVTRVLYRFFHIIIQMVFVHSMLYVCGPWSLLCLYFLFIFFGNAEVLLLIVTPKLVVSNSLKKYNYLVEENMR